MKPYISSSEHGTIALLDLICGVSEIMIEQDDSTLPGLPVMLEALINASMAALKLYPCHLVSESEKDSYREKAVKLMENGFGSETVSGTAWFSFFTVKTEKILEIPVRKNGKPKKNGWLKNVEKRQAIQDVQDVLHGIMAVFDPDYEFTEDVEMGVSASKEF